MRGAWTPATVALAAGLAWLTVQLVVLSGPHLGALPWPLWLVLATLAVTLLKPLAFLFAVAIQYVGLWAMSGLIWALALWLTFR